MACFDQLNLTTTPSVVVEVDVVRLDLEENMFGVGALIEEFSRTLVTRELSLFTRLSISSFLHVQIH